MKNSSPHTTGDKILLISVIIICLILSTVGPGMFIGSGNQVMPWLFMLLMFVIAVAAALFLCKDWIFSKDSEQRKD
jgi:uncharacterized membrane protein YkvI